MLRRLAAEMKSFIGEFNKAGSVLKEHSVEEIIGGLQEANLKLLKASGKLLMEARRSEGRGMERRSIGGRR